MLIAHFFTALEMRNGVIYVSFLFPFSRVPLSQNQPDTHHTPSLVPCPVQIFTIYVIYSSPNKLAFIKEMPDDRRPEEREDLKPEELDDLDTDDLDLRLRVFRFGL